MKCLSLVTGNCHVRFSEGCGAGNGPASTRPTVGVNGGQSLAVIGKLLGHSKILTTLRYAHLADDLVRQASEQIGSTLAATLYGGGPGDQDSPNPNDPMGEGVSRR